MKKVFLALLCAGLFVACGNKKTVEPEAVVDTVATEVVEEAPVVEEPVVAEEPAQETKAAPAKKTTTPAKKKNDDGKLTSSSTTTPPTVEEHAKQAAGRIANAAIDRGEKEATNQIQTQKRR